MRRGHRHTALRSLLVVDENNPNPRPGPLTEVFGAPPAGGGPGGGPTSTWAQKASDYEYNRAMAKYHTLLSETFEGGPAERARADGDVARSAPAFGGTLLSAGRGTGLSALSALSEGRGHRSMDLGATALPVRHLG